jgi:steroid delta-isomerase-like uncharacterized protein
MYRSQNTSAKVEKYFLKKGDNMSDTEKIKAVVRRTIDELWNQGKMEVVDELFSPSLRFHYFQGEIRGHEGIKQYVLGFRNAFPDLNITIEDQIAEGNKEASRFIVTGTHKGKLINIPPTGVKISVTANCIHHFADDKITEVWNEYNNFGMLQQLGVIPSS